MNINLTTHSTCIVILSYNHPEHTKNCVSSVINFNIPIYLIHNGSELKNIEELQNNFPLINHLNISINKGYSGGVNFGLDQAFKKYQWVIFLTNDTFVIQLPSNLKFGITAPLIFRRNEEKIDSIGGKFSFFQSKLYHCKSIEDFHSNKILWKNYIPGSAFVMDKNTWDQLRPFDEFLHTYWEDVDLSMKAHQKNILLHVDPQFRLRHKISKTTSKNKFYTTYLFQRNKRIISLRYAHSFYRPILRIKFLIEKIYRINFKHYNSDQKSLIRDSFNLSYTRDR